MLKVVRHINHAVLTSFVNVVANVNLTAVEQLIPFRLPVTSTTGGRDGIES